MHKLVGASERAPGLCDDAVLVVVGALVLLLEVGVQLYLVHRGVGARGADEVLDVAQKEVGHADVAHEAATPGLDEGAPGIDVLALLGVGQVDEVEVDVVEPHAAGALAEQ